MNKSAMTLVICLLASNAQAGIYKWTDSDGNAQYSSTPPQGQSYEKIETAPPPAKPDPAVLENARSQLREASEKAQEEKARRGLRAQDQQVDQRMAENCRIARENFEKLEARTGILREDPETGTMVRLTFEERQAQMAKAQKDIDYFCEGYTINASKQ